MRKYVKFPLFIEEAMSKDKMAEYIELDVETILTDYCTEKTIEQRKLFIKYDEINKECISYFDIYDVIEILFDILKNNGILKKVLVGDKMIFITEKSIYILRRAYKC